MKKMMQHKRYIIETKNPSRLFCAIQKDSIKKKLEGSIGIGTKKRSSDFF